MFQWTNYVLISDAPTRLLKVSNPNVARDLKRNDFFTSINCHVKNVRKPQLQNETKDNFEFKTRIIHLRKAKKRNKVLNFKLKPKSSN